MDKEDMPPSYTVEEYQKLVERQRQNIRIKNALVEDYKRQIEDRADFIHQHNLGAEFTAFMVAKRMECSDD